MKVNETKHHSFLLFSPFTVLTFHPFRFGVADTSLWWNQTGVRGRVTGSRCSDTAECIWVSKHHWRLAASAEIGSIMELKDGRGPLLFAYWDEEWNTFRKLPKMEMKLTTDHWEPHRASQLYLDPLFKFLLLLWLIWSLKVTDMICTTTSVPNKLVIL